jgi:hypothetical protein
LIRHGRVRLFDTFDEHDVYCARVGFIPTGSQVLENLSKSEAEKSAGMLAFLISIFSVRKV